MRSFAFAVSLICATGSAAAFELDGFAGGESLSDAAQKFATFGYALSPDSTQGAPNYRAGPYGAVFCHDKLAYLDREINTSIFNGLFSRLKFEFGNPDVDIYSVDGDLISLHWNHPEYIFILNSGISDLYKVRFHHITVIYQKINKAYCGNDK